MNFHTPVNDDDEPTGMNAMVDIVFILLAFFILAMQLNQPELDVPLESSGQDLATGAVVEDFPDTVTIELHRTADGVAIIVGQAPLPVNGFAAITEKLSRINLPNATVVIGAETDLSVEQIAMAVDAVLASPMKQISLAQLVGG